MHLYVHVPFCARRCSYCDFAIAVRRVVPAERFVDAVLAEYGWRREREVWEPPAWSTVYLGGGTPSRLPPDALRRLLDAFARAPDAEVTLEANPDDVSSETASAWSAAGVTRVSLGAQSFDDAVLNWMHRTHDSSATGVAVARLRDAGITDVSLDLIFALPDELEHDPRRDLDAAVALEPQHISAYGLTREEGTPYARWTKRGAATPATEGRYEAEFLLAHELLNAAGYEHYEISNYARPGHRAQHNSAYWSGRDYLGLGPSAHSLRAEERRWNVPHWAAYERTVSAGADPVAGLERLTRPQRDLERIYLALRTIDGLSATEADRLAPGPRAAAERAGWLEPHGPRLTPTPAGWLVLDELVTVLSP
jgi:oxygen-independent coproporphyrinogen-3 oxidase